MLRRTVIICGILLLLAPLPPKDAAGTTRDTAPLQALLETIDPQSVPSGILYDRMLPLSDIENYTGSPSAGTVSLFRWKQIYFELYHASLTVPAWPDPHTLPAAAAEYGRRRVTPLAIVDVTYDRIRRDAIETGVLTQTEEGLAAGTGNPFISRRAFAAAPLVERTYRGGAMQFVIPKEWYITNGDRLPGRIEVDFNDGIGYRTVALDQTVAVRYLTPGKKTIRIRAGCVDGRVLYGFCTISVAALQTPLPHDTLAITADISYAGGFASGEAYVYRADPLAPITHPVIVVEGFDLDNTMNWDELYALLNQEALVETLRAEGFDAVVLNFTDATDYIQRNAFVLVKLVQEVMGTLDPGTSCAIIGASMGGLVARYALAYMEQNGIDHGARTFISFDVPHNGANIPLGVQYWMDFFSGQSADAEFLLSRLDTPAARQMLVYHHTTPPGANPEPDSLRPAFLGDLAAVGSFPDECRMVAVANGSGMQANQGFAAGEQIVLYEYSSFLVDITGNVWAVPDGGTQMIFHGVTDIIFLPKDEMIVTVSGTIPYDNAPGGFRTSMAQMDSSEAPYGDIVALHDSHCFIPTISALALDTQDLFLAIDNHPDILTLTPFDQVYYPAENQEHVTITSESAEWFLHEIRRGPTGTSVLPEGAHRPVVLYQNYPNPFNPATAISFSVPEGVQVRVTIFDITGRRIARLYDDLSHGGTQTVAWDGRNHDGVAAASGVYLCSLMAGDQIKVRKLVLVR